MSARARPVRFNSAKALSVERLLDASPKIQLIETSEKFRPFNLVIMTSVTFRRGDEIDQREAGVHILQTYWKGFAPRDVSEWGQRIENAGGYVVAAYVDNAIAGILEAIRLD